MIKQVLFQLIEPALYVSAAWRLHLKVSNVPSTNLNYILASFWLNCVLSLLVRIVQAYRCYFNIRAMKTKAVGKSLFCDNIGVFIGSNLMPILLTITLFQDNSTMRGNSRIHLLAFIIIWLGLTFNLNILYHIATTSTTNTKNHMSSYIHAALFLGGIGNFFMTDLFHEMSFNTFIFVSIYSAIQGASLIIYDHSSIQFVLSRGEWILVSTLLSFLFADYTCFISWPSIQKYANYTACQTMSERIPDQLRIAQSGFIGTIFGGGVLLGFPFTRLSDDHLNEENQKKRLIHRGYALRILFFKIFAVVITVMSTLTMSFPSAKNWLESVGQPIYWLIDFLKVREGGISSSSSSSSRTVLFPRYYWLIYWSAVLFFSIPPAVLVSRCLSTIPKQKRRKVVVVSRKYFHLIAILLFGPVTYFAPVMMSFAYAVASCLLLLIEFIRYGTYQSRIGRDCESSKARRGNKMFLSHDFLGLNDFYNAFLGDNDSYDCFVLTHIFLILGCAIPLWYHLLFINVFDMQPVLPFIGIIALGVGDSAGAIIGTYLGKSFWPGSKKTVEGSVGMLSSTIICLTGFQYLIGERAQLNEIFLISIAMTFLEASTCQIDNLYLPLMSIGFLLL